eukprot:s434_g3.t1
MVADLRCAHLGPCQIVTRIAEPLAIPEDIYYSISMGADIGHLPQNSLLSISGLPEGHEPARKAYVSPGDFVIIPGKPDRLPIVLGVLVESPDPFDQAEEFLMDLLEEQLDNLPCQAKIETSLPQVTFIVSFFLSVSELILECELIVTVILILILTGFVSESRLQNLVCDLSKYDRVQAVAELPG